MTALVRRSLAEVRTVLVLLVCAFVCLFQYSCLVDSTSRLLNESTEPIILL